MTIREIIICMVRNTQILMSVERVHITVLNYALILLVLSHVTATLDTDLHQMAVPAMVI